MLKLLHALPSAGGHFSSGLSAGQRVATSSTVLDSKLGKFHDQGTMLKKNITNK
jgi:hypothetical protein